MPSRFEPAPQWVKDMVRDVVEREHPTLSCVPMLILFDTRKRTSKGALVAAQIRKASDLMKAVDVGEHEFVISLDARLFRAAGVTDEEKRAIVYHELCHVMPDETGYRLVGHDYTLFNGEVKRHGGERQAMAFQVRLAEALAGLYYEKDGGEQ